MNPSPKVRILGVLFGGNVSPFVGIKKEYVKSRLTYSFVYKVINPMTFWYFISVIYRLFLLILLHEPRYPGG